MTCREPLITVDGRRITDRLLKRSLRISIIAGAMGMAWWAMTAGMPLIMFMEAIGASGVLMGLVSMVIQVAFIMQVPAALLVERLATRKRVWAVTTLISRALWFVPAIMIYFLPDRPAILAWGMIGILAVSSLLVQSVNAFWFSWMADLVPDRIRGRFWGTRQSWTMAAFLIGILYSGYVLDSFRGYGRGAGSLTGFGLVFTVGGVLGCLDILIHLKVPEPLVFNEKASEGWIKVVLTPLRNRDFLFLTISMGVYTFAVALTSLGNVFLKKHFNVSYTQISATSVSSSLGVVISGFVSGYVMDRVGARAFGVLSVIFAPFIMVVWFFVEDYSTDFVTLFGNVMVFGSLVRTVVGLLPSEWAAAVTGFEIPQAVWLVLFANFFAGALFSGIGICQLNLVGSRAPRKGRVMAMAAHWSVVGLIGAFGSVVAGRVMDYFTSHPSTYVFPTGTHLAFHHVLVIAYMIICWVAVLPLLLLVSRAKGELAVGDAASRMLVSNPLRVATNIYLMGAGISSRRRARVVRELGRNRTALAVSDLIEKLDDASLDVREETVFALGSIASPDAVDALIMKLEDPYSDVSPQVAKALRISKDPRSVGVLVSRLNDKDRETRSQSARTLGEIGDPRAVPSLMDLLVQDDDPKIMASSSDALARLGEVAAIYDILPRMKRTRNPVLKRSLAVAIGDLLGQRDEFYKILTKEEQTRGAEAVRLIKDLGRSIEQATRGQLQSQKKILMDKISKLEMCYDDEDYDGCVTPLFDLGIGLSALKWCVAYGGNSKALVNELIWHDQRFGVGMWYLDLLREQWETVDLPERDHVDILLGIYVLASNGL